MNGRIERGAMGSRRGRFAAALAVAALGVLTACAQPASTGFQPTWESLQGYETARWFRDAKFGIFIHWGAYSVPAFASEWYPREMYQRGSAAFHHHVATYGPQSNTGYKDLIRQFRAERWDPDAWAELFARAGAQYVVPVAEHHDGFAMYSTSRSRWSAATMGPRRDIIGELAAAVRRRGLVFGLSSHRAEHWWFMHPGKHFDSDVNDPAFADLYGPAEPDTTQPDSLFLNDWYARCTELVERYRPQLFYFDWWIEQPAFAPFLKRFAAFYYNRSREWNAEVVINYKNTAFPERAAVLDIERGRSQKVRPLPWQTCTSIGKRSWGFISSEENRAAGELIHVLADIVSKNGCLLLNIGPRADGTIPEEQQTVLRDMGVWLEVNGESIYRTRPWEVSGEGVTPQTGGMFSEARSRPYTPEDIRYTTRGGAVYAIILGWPGRTCRIRALRPREGSEIRLLGYDRPLEWKWVEAQGLEVRFPEVLQSETKRPCRYAYVLKCEGTREQVPDPPSVHIGGREITGEALFADTATVELRSEVPGAAVYYTLDGSTPTDRSARYTRPFPVNVAGRLSAIAASEGLVASLPVRVELRKTRAIRNITYRFPYSPTYQGEGDLTLADEVDGGLDYNNGRWLGFESIDAEFVVELKTPRPVREVHVGCLENQDSWIFFPPRIEVSVSTDGSEFRPVGQVATPELAPNPSIRRMAFVLRVGGDRVRFVRVLAKNVAACPPWHKGAGGKAWLFLDEVRVR